MTRPSGERWSSMESKGSTQTAVLHLEDVAKAVRVGFIGAEEAEVVLLGVFRKDIAQQLTELARRFVALGGGLFDFDGVVGEQGQSPARPAACRRWRAGWRPCGALLWARAPPGPAADVPARRRASPAGSCSSNPPGCAGAQGWSGRRRPAPGARGRYPQRARRRPLAGPSSPSACAGRWLGQRGRVV